MLPIRNARPGRRGLDARTLPGAAGFYSCRETADFQAGAATPIGHGTGIAVWPDLSPAVSPAIQPTTGSRPTMDRVSCPGRPTIRFETGAHLRITAPSSPIEVIGLVFLVPAGAVSPQIAVTQDAAGSTTKTAFAIQVG